MSNKTNKTTEKSMIDSSSGGLFFQSRYCQEIMVHAIYHQFGFLSAVPLVGLASCMAPCSALTSHSKTIERNRHRLRRNLHTVNSTSSAFLSTVELYLMNNNIPLGVPLQS